MALLPAGMKVVVVSTPHTVRISWRARLLSWPWRPWVSVRIVEHPMWGVMGGNDCYTFGNTLFVNQRQFEVLKTEERFTNPIDQGENQ